MAMPNAPEYEPGASSWWNSSVSFEQRGRPPLRKMWLTAAIRSASAAWRDMCAPGSRARRLCVRSGGATDASRSIVGAAPCVKGDTTH
jgi:hypothetical protein